MNSDLPPFVRWMAPVACCVLLAACATPREPAGPPGPIGQNRCYARPAASQCITSAPRPLSFLAEGTPVKVRVDARCEWNPTGVILQRGSRYRLAVTEVLEPWADSWQPPSDLAQGWPGIFARGGRYVQRWSRAPQLPMYALVGAQGREERTFFVVGRELELVAERGDELLFFANDWRSQYDNNKGCVEVEIRKVGP